MPLTKGKSDVVIAKNIKEMMDSYHHSGHIGNTTPRSTEHAQKIAIAAAYRKAGRGKRK